MAEHDSGEILTLLNVLDEHWDAVERDLYHAHFTWEDVGTQRLPIGPFCSTVLNSPPGTAVYHQITEGWDVGDRLAALQLDALKLQLWLKTKDAQAKPPRNRPEPTWQPGMPEPEAKLKEYEVMTIEDYMRRVGMEG